MNATLLPLFLLVMAILALYTRFWSILAQEGWKKKAKTKIDKEKDQPNYRDTQLHARMVNDHKKTSLEPKTTILMFTFKSEKT